MTPLASAVKGGLAGLAGAALAQILTVWVNRAHLTGLLQGPAGVPFFGVAVYTAAFYGAIGAGARGVRSAAAGAAAALLMIVVPMFVLTRAEGMSVRFWQIAMTVIYGAAIWTAIGSVGAVAARGKRSRGALAAIVGSTAGYAALAVALKLFPSWAASPWNPDSFLPSPVNLMDGLLSGAGLCLALSLDEMISRRTA